MKDNRYTQTLSAEKTQREGAWDDPRLDWWREARFGAFIHWGIYAMPDRWKDRKAHSEWWTQEWVQKVRCVPREEYTQLCKAFNPIYFDAEAWVKVFKDAGQKYVVLTAKHHDGFCLFDSKLTDYNIVKATPFKRDVVAEVAEACQKHGLKFCVYYSQTQDWHHPDGHGNDWDDDPAKKDFDRYVSEYVHAQVTELLTQYGNIGLVWFDTPQIMKKEQSQGLVELVHGLQPDCLVCGRVGHGQGDYGTGRDNEYLVGNQKLDWECPSTMNDTWGFNPEDSNWKSVDELLANLKRVVSNHGNYLLNVGPDHLGQIPKASIERLQAIGAYLREHPIKNLEQQCD